MTKMHTEIVIREWLSHALKCKQMLRDGFDSIDVEELLGTDARGDYLHLGFALFVELSKQYVPHAHELIATLIVSIDDSAAIRSNSFKKLLEGKYALRQPPELYLEKRSTNIAPYVTEEYKVPIDQNEVLVPEGIIYAYSRSFRGDHRDSFVNAFYFEHYPSGSVNFYS